MTTNNVHPTLASAYRQGLLDLLSHGQTVPSVRETTSPASGFGKGDRPSLELLGYSFSINDPWSCLVDSEVRPLRLPYCIGSLLWTLAGSNDLAYLQSYHADARNFSDDGISLSGAFGKRLFRYDERIDQIEAIIERLRDDPASRRTFAAICDPHDNVRRSREYPCCIGTQYFLRNGELQSITYMRAQHAMLILPYDAFLFMMIHCLVAARLGVRAGRYHHICGTFHIYESEREFAQRIVEEPLRPIQVDRASGTPAELQDILSFERMVRDAGLAADSRALDQMLDVVHGEPAFDRYAKLILLAHWFRSVDGERNPAFGRLDEVSQRMLVRQWSDADRRRAATV